jgi:ATP-dependent Clp protease ATP-binding subunit ClpC
VVRPVRAGIDRKRKMREELLAHVTAIFEDEATCGDESAALARTAERFGDPAELTRQLQTSVRRRERAAYLVEWFVGDPSRESAARRGLRYAALIWAGCTVALVVISVMIVRWEEWLTLARLPSWLAPVNLAFLTFCATLLEQGMRQALFGPRGRNWAAAIAIGVATWLLVPTFTFVWVYAFGGAIVATIFDIWLLFLLGSLAPVALVSIVCLCIHEIRYREEWASLKID